MRWQNVSRGGNVQPMKLKIRAKGEADSKMERLIPYGAATVVCRVSKWSVPYMCTGKPGRAE